MIKQQESIRQEQLTTYAALLLRLGLGGLALAHGLLKILVFTIPGTVAFFGTLGFPPILAYGVIGGEVLGGLALILGVQVRVASLLLLPILLGATWQHAGAGWLFSAQGGGYEFPLFWSLALVVQALLGQGAYALPIRRPTPNQMVTA